MNDELDLADWHQELAWCKTKAKEASKLPAEDASILDRSIAQLIRQKLEHKAAQYWWSLFGSEGHSLETLEDEARFVCNLDQAFIFPTASSLLSPATEARRQYSVPYITRRGEYTTADFIAPPPSRLLELMLYGFFPYRGRWIYLIRPGKALATSNLPEQWMVLPEPDSPEERLGVSVTVLGERVSPRTAFSSLPDRKKVRLAEEFGLPGTHEEWLQSISENLAETRPRGQALSIELAGEYPSNGIPLAELLVNGGHIPGKKVEAINGNLFDLSPENLTTKSSRGRKMTCNACRKPTTAQESERVKDSTGSTFRICNACRAWGARRQKR